MIAPLTPEELIHERMVNAIMVDNVATWLSKRRQERAAVVAPIPKVLTPLEQMEQQVEELKTQLATIKATHVPVKVLPPGPSRPDPDRYRTLHVDQPGHRPRGGRGGKRE
jgi:hypothetical protein